MNSIIAPIRLTEQAEDILKERYYDKDGDGNLVEDWYGLSSRVAHHIASQELLYDIDPSPYEEEFFNAIYNLDFLPNTPCLMNAGSRGGLGLLSACFVQVPEDSIDSIMQHAWYSAKLFQAGAGVGYNFSHLRAEGENVRSSMRPSSGAVSFMKHIFNSIGDVVKQGGRRRAAMMGLLNDDHPELEKFMTFKNDEQSLVNFNISVFATNRFMKAIEDDSLWQLKARVSGDVFRTVQARELFNKMIYNNWSMAEPGMIFADNINATNALRKWRRIESVNPCGEATLFNFENCCLGSVNLPNHLREDDFDWKKLEDTVRTGIRFLDNVVDANRHVSPEFRDASLNTRRIGLGVTGFADALIHLNSVYGSSSSYDIARNVAMFINHVATDESSKIAHVKGVYPLWKKSYHKDMDLPLRNVSLLAIAPEGSRSLITNTSAGIEPNFGRTVVRTKKGIGSGTFTHRLAGHPAFVTTYEVPLEAHIKMQATWQNAMDSNLVGQSISKTNNAPRDVTLDELGEAYLEAWRLGCKGLTIYRDGSRDAVYFERRDDEARDENGKLVMDCTTGVCDIGFAK